MRCGGLYGAAAAAALLVAPAVLARPAVHDPENGAPAPKIVTLDVSKKGQGREAVTFHIDVRPSSQDCSPDSIRINGHVLGHNVEGEGGGVLSVPGGRQVVANWYAGCLQTAEGPLLQSLAVILGQLDGQEIRAVGFSTIVSQRTNLMAIHKFPEFPEEGGDSEAYLYNALTTQIFHIDDKLEAPLAALGPPAWPLGECASLSCMWTYLSGGVEHAADEPGDEVADANDSVAHAHDDALPAPEEGEDEGEDEDEDEDWWHERDGEMEIWDEDEEGQPIVYDIADVGGEWVLTGHHAMTPEEMDAWEEAKLHDYRFYARQPPMLMTIALAVLALCSLSLWGIHYLHRRTVRLSHLTEREAEPTKAHGHGRDARKTAAAGLVSSLLPRWTLRGDAASEDEKGALRQRYDAETESLAATTTMEEEIAQLRQVASFVDDIVAAEEGRARQPHNQQQPPAYSSTEQGPPPYDSVSNDARSSPVGADDSRPISGDLPGRKE